MRPGAASRAPNAANGGRACGWGRAQTSELPANPGPGGSGPPPCKNNAMLAREPAGLMPSAVGTNEPTEGTIRAVSPLPRPLSSKTCNAIAKNAAHDHPSPAGSGTAPGAAATHGRHPSLGRSPPRRPANCGGTALPPLPLLDRLAPPHRAISVRTAGPGGVMPALR